MLDRNIDDLLIKDKKILGAIIVDEHGLALRAKNLQKKCASYTKNMLDLTKSLAIKPEDKTPIIVIEGEERSMILHKNKNLIMGVVRENDSVDP